MNDKKLIIMRGISGSGKSTKAKLLGINGVVYGSDDYWGPNYEFDKEKLGDAHKWNHERVLNAMQQGKNLIVVDNTNTQFWEMRGYVESALEYDYCVEFQEPDTEWKFNAEVLYQKNQHNVPLEIIEQMILNWEHNPTIEAILKSERPAQLIQDKLD